MKSARTACNTANLTSFKLVRNLLRPDGRGAIATRGEVSHECCLPHRVDRLHCGTSGGRGATNAGGAVGAHDGYPPRPSIARRSIETSNGSGPGAPTATTAPALRGQEVTMVAPAAGCGEAEAAGVAGEDVSARIASTLEEICTDIVGPDAGTADRQAGKTLCGPCARDPVHRSIFAGDSATPAPAASGDSGRRACRADRPTAR